MTEPRPLLTVTQTAAFLNIGRRTVYKLVRAGDLPAYRVGQSLRFKPDDIDAYLENQLQQPGAEGRAPWLRSVKDDHATSDNTTQE